MSTTKLQRESAVKNVINESDKITRETPGAQLASQFFNQQVAPLIPGQRSLPPPPSSAAPAAPPPPPTPPQLVVECGDTFNLTRRMLSSHPEIKNTQVIVLNMASDVKLAGGWKERAGESQEEMLCYQSTLYATLKRSENVYPFKEHLDANEKNGCGAILSPAVAIHRGSTEVKFALLKRADRRVVSVVSVAAPFKPPKIKQGGKERYRKPQNEVQMKEKLRMIYRIAANKEKTVLVLEGFGCGFFDNPVHRVAELIKEIVLELEFVCCFSRVYWFVNDKPTFGVFSEVILPAK